MERADIVLSGNYSEYGTLESFIALFAQGKGYSRLFIEGFQLTIKEAFVNAIKHGNKERSNLTISCGLIATENILLASIRDCGKGFNLDEVPNPIDPRHILELSGRGIFIIRSIAEIIGIERDLDGSTLILRYMPY